MTEAIAAHKFYRADVFAAEGPVDTRKRVAVVAPRSKGGVESATSFGQKKGGAAAPPDLLLDEENRQVATIV